MPQKPQPKLMTPRFLLPLMMVVGITVIGLRTGEVWTTVQHGDLFAPITRARAEEAAPAKPTAPETPKPADAKAHEEDHPPAAPLAHEDEDSPESTLYKQLSGRRDQLEKRAKDLDDREALLHVAEGRVDNKLKEMETLRTQIQSLLGQADAAQQVQLENLVKIYEIMKPKEAAKIFESLDMPILLGVVQKMKPARTAAVMAEMDPQKAKDITTALTRQNQLPQIK